MLGALLRRSFARARGLLLALAVVLALFEMLIVVAAAYVQEQRGFTQMIAVLPPVIQQMAGGIFSSFGTMVAFGYFHPIVIVVFVGLAVVVGSEPAADVESGVVDLVLARPVWRGHLVTRSLLMLLAVTAGVAALMVATSWFSQRLVAPAPLALQPRILGKLAVNLVAVSLVPGTLSLLAASFLKRRGMAAGAVGILTLALYLLNFLAELLPRLRPSAPLSPFHYYQPIGIVSGFGTRWAGDVLLLVGTAAVLSALAFVVFSRRDL